ncbi:MAG TPA: threonine-phosphate decarboxylase CobD [Anaerolineae bacterium]|nr:threonine-phosphate decarboxylase CobD [Anaerolineae bacterium]
MRRSNLLRSTNNSERLGEHGGNVKRLVERLGINTDDLLDFSSNINPYGPPEGVITAITRSIDTIRDYPEQRAESFVMAVAEALWVKEEHVVAGNGSSELIYLLPQVFKANKALLVVPSFTEYELSLRKSGADITYRGALSAEDALWAIRDVPRDIGIVMLGTPNNPCGYRLDRDSLLEIIDMHTSCLWVIDEAFIDFVSDRHEVSLTRDSINRDNLIVLRSLTKIYGIAGLRLGYMVASPGIAARIREEKYPWSVNAMALAAGVEVLKDNNFIGWSVHLLIAEARRLYEEISRIDGLVAYEPAANYILVKIEREMPSSRLQEELLRRGMAVRDCSSYTGMDDRHFRVAVKRPEDNDRLLDALRDVFNR